MKSVVQPVNGGPVQVLDVPRPAAVATEVLVRTMASVISPGTERAVTAPAQSSLLAKRARLAMVSGCDVAGIDPAQHARIVATGSGVLALDELGDATTDQVVDWSRGRGADAVLVCAATSSTPPRR